MIETRYTPRAIPEIGEGCVELVPGVPGKRLRVHEIAMASDGLGVYITYEVEGKDKGNDPGRLRPRV